MTEQLIKFDYIERGDCFDLLKQLPNKSVDVSFTSPPYNRKRNDKYEWYDDQIKNYFNFLVGFTDELLRVTKRHVIVNVQKNFYQKKDVFKYIGHYANEIVEIIIWEKSNPMPASGHNITNAYEFFIILGNHALKSNTTYTKNIITTSVNSNMPKEHKAVMKKEVCEWFIEKFTKPGDIVLDPFIGVGTTARVCAEQNRHYIGYELNEIYYQMAYENLKGAKCDRND